MLVVALFGLAALMEIIQIPLAARAFGLDDLFANLSGVGAGALTVYLVQSLWRSDN